MKKMLKMSIAAAIVMGIGSVSAQAEDGVDILSNVKVNGEIRARFENVEQDNATPNANAITNRLVLGVNGDIAGTDWLSAYVEMTDVHALNDNYNDITGPNSAQNNSKVADSEQTRLTQSYIDAKFGKTLLRVGRQMVNLDNQRFVGAVGWRQMPQTFDAVAVVDNSVENLNIVAALVSQVNSIHYQTKAETDSVILNVSYNVMPELKVTAYDYMLADTHDTVGVALTGNVALSDGMKLNYRAEMAQQSDPSREVSTSGVTADASYMNIELGLNMDGILIGAGMETLSGADTGTATEFTTPLATLHGKNGWADMFLNTPAGGLVDTNVMVGYKAKDFGTAKIIYHTFATDTGASDYGTEIDAVYKNNVPGVKGLTAMLKAAVFTAETAGGYIDTQKTWLMLDYKFTSK